MTILMIDDNPADVRLVREALAERQLPTALHWEPSGDAALRHLQGAATLPDLVLLDWNLRGLSGQEVLRALKTDAHLRRIPVVVLTTSTAPADVQDAYAGHANAYMVKSEDFDACLTLVGVLHQHWLQAVLLPGALR